MTHTFFLAPLRLSSRTRCLLAVWLSAALGSACAFAADSAESTIAQNDTIRLLVLDLELVGDLSDPVSNAEHGARIKKTSEQLRAELSRVPRYEIVDPAPARETIEALSATQYLYKCNGCEIDIARQLNAEQVLVAWIHRVSQLILTLTYEIREVPSGEPIRRKAFEFRGDNDAGWSRAVRSMANDLGAQ